MSKTSKPLFEAGDFFPNGVPIELAGFEASIKDIAAYMANKKLSSLGLDADTPEKLKRLESDLRKEAATVDGLKGLNQSLFEQRNEARERLTDLERQLAEAPTVYMAKGYGYYDKWTEDSADLDAHPSHTAKLVDIKKIGGKA